MWLLATAHSLGFPRDEGMYFRAATDYVGWWRAVLEHGQEALQQGAIDGAWSDNHEHPVLMKTLFGISWWLLHEQWHIVKYASTAYRIPAMISAGGALWTTYLFGARAYGRRAGLVAAVLLGLMPRVFFHSHLSCFDVPMMSVWILCVYVHWRALDTRSLAWALAAGFVFGLALETKHNAWFLPVALVPHALFVQRREILRALRAGRVAIPTSLVSMALIGPIVFLGAVAVPVERHAGSRSGYFEFHLNHEYYNIEYLGRNYFGPPSPKSYLPVMVLATVPTVTLLLFGIGAVERALAARGAARDGCASAWASATGAKRRQPAVEIFFARSRATAWRPTCSSCSRSPSPSARSSSRRRPSSAAPSTGCRLTPPWRSSRVAASIA